MKRKPNTPITTVRTGTGDAGTTFLRTPGISKSDPIVDFVGDLDEACAALGRVEIGFDFGSVEECNIQHNLSKLFSKTIVLMFEIGAMVHSSTAKDMYLEETIETYCSDVESVIDKMIEKDLLDPLEGFIIPNQENGDLFLARAIVRRCERSAIKAGEMDFVKLLNVASDFLFVLSWYTTHYYEQWTGFSKKSDSAKEGSPIL